MQPSVFNWELWLEALSWEICKKAWHNFCLKIDDIEACSFDDLLQANACFDSTLTGGLWFLQLAAKAGIAMEQRSLPQQDLKNILLQGKHLIIALVDKDLHSLGLPLWRNPRQRALDIGFKGTCRQDCRPQGFLLWVDAADKNRDTLDLDFTYDIWHSQKYSMTLLQCKTCLKCCKEAECWQDMHPFPFWPFLSSPTPDPLRRLNHCLITWQAIILCSVAIQATAITSSSEILILALHTWASAVWRLLSWTGPGKHLALMRTCW